MSSVPQNQPIQSVASPLEIAKAIGAKTPAQRDNQYRGQDRRGGLRLAADLARRAAAVKDTVDRSPEARLASQARLCAECSRPTLGAFGPAPAFNFWATICQSCKDKADGELERQVKGSSVAIDQMVRSSLGLPVNVAFTDAGDGLGLPVAAHNGVEGDLASEGERPFILSGPLQTEIGATGRTFVVRTSAAPTAERIRDMQVKLGFHPAGYGEPRGVETKQADGAYVTTWSCDRSCD